METTEYMTLVLQVVSATCSVHHGKHLATVQFDLSPEY